ncbi:MAG: imidazole glycerol phosphate synthase subunit HisH [Oceanospirillaceae bacterium]|nr:imidazole glycerol phosphate synthase subunit HisH [Oceanospirillaceae bacterium]
MSTVAVIDYGMGNLHSVAKALEHVMPNVNVQVTSDPKVIADADRVILPGVGAIRDCVAQMLAQGVDVEVADTLQSGKPFLGICVGYQALMDTSEENGGSQCLGVYPGEVKQFADGMVENGERLKVPHMGWNRVSQTIDHPLWQGIEDNSRFYFVHSYYVAAKNAAQVAGRCHYGLDFDVALSDKNGFCVQFHPEKSHTAGLQLLTNFLNWDGKL